MLPLLHEALGLRALERPDHPAVVGGDARPSYGELWDRSVRLANALAQHGIRRGDRVAVLMENVPACATAQFGAWLADAVTVPLNPQTKAEKLSWLLRDSGAAALLTEDHLAGAFLPAVQERDLRVVLVTTEDRPVPSGSEDFDAALEAASPDVPDSRNIAPDLAAILYTSGTAGRPKGVMHTHGSLAFARDSVAKYLDLQPEDRLLCALPLSFGYGLFQLLPATTVGATVFLERSLAYPAEVFARMLENEVTTFAGVPTMFAMMLAHDEKWPIRFPSVRLVTCAAAPLPEKFVPGIGRMFPSADLVQMYGQTECIRACWLPPDHVERKPGSVGIAIPGTEVFVLDAEGREAGVGETGILHVRGPHVMAGYWNDRRRTAEALVAGPGPGERMLRTGDHFRRDSDGFHYFVARSDEIIKSRGEKVSPTEVENAIYRLPEVGEVMVLGVPDPVLGEAVCALVTLKPGAALHEREVKRACFERLEGFMVPKQVVFVESLPRNERGKLSRRLAQDAFRDLLPQPQPARA